MRPPSYHTRRLHQLRLPADLQGAVRQIERRPCQLLQRLRRSITQRRGDGKTWHNYCHYHFTRPQHFTSSCSQHDSNAQCAADTCALTINNEQLSGHFHFTVVTIANVINNVLISGHYYRDIETRRLA